MGLQVDPGGVRRWRWNLEKGLRFLYPRSVARLWVWRVAKCFLGAGREYCGPGILNQACHKNAPRR